MAHAHALHEGGACLLIYTYMAYNRGGLRETAARCALRENTVAVTEAIQKHLAVFPRYLKQTRFMTECQVDDIASTMHSSANKANNFMSAVEFKVSDPDKGHKWLKKLIEIFMEASISEYAVAQNIAKVYSKYIAIICT